MDEVSQLSILVKTIRTKSYNEEAKMQLLMLLLGYIEIVSSVFEKLFKFKHTKLSSDKELEQSQTDFERFIKFVRLIIKGILPNP